MEMSVWIILERDNQSFVATQTFHRKVGGGIRTPIGHKRSWILIFK
jgi:hypothetical protein